MLLESANRFVTSREPGPRHRYGVSPTGTQGMPARVSPPHVRGRALWSDPRFLRWLPITQIFARIWRRGSGSNREDGPVAGDTFELALAAFGEGDAGAGDEVPDGGGH